MIAAGNVFSNISPQGTHEQLTELLRAPALRVERIVSHGHASPPDFWYDQEFGEWVLLLEGAAVLRFENEPEPLRLGAGDFVLIPSRQRHRIEWTDPERP